MSRFRFVEDHAAGYPVKRLCELVEVSRSGFFAWRDRPPSQRQRDDDELGFEIRAIHERSRGHLRRAADRGSAPPARSLPWPQTESPA